VLVAESERADANAKADDAKATEEADDGGGSSKTIIIVVVIVIILVAVGVTLFAQKKKILCFKPAPGSEEATGESPLLKGASKTSPSRATTASGTTIDKSRPSASALSGK